MAATKETKSKTRTYSVQIRMHIDITHEVEAASIEEALQFGKDTSFKEIIDQSDGCYDDGTIAVRGVYETYTTIPNAAN